MQQTLLTMPNPQDWVDVRQAMAILKRSRATVYDMSERGVLHIHKIGSLTVLWRAEVVEVAGALKRLEYRGHA